MCVLFCVWLLLLNIMFLRFIRGVICYQYCIPLYYCIVFCFMDILQFCLFSYLLMEHLVISSFGLSRIKLPWTFVRTSCEHMFSSSLGKYLGVDFLGCMVGVCKKLLSCFSKCFEPFYIPSSSIWEFQVFCILANIWSCLSFLLYVF